ncbi:hypothetical protein GF312_03925 [Candidatus Poribacteria bacterium]|nr:hypothetical protein [Candidatus Poribacteria bacterium]
MERKYCIRLDWVKENNNSSYWRCWLRPRLSEPDASFNENNFRHRSNIVGYIKVSGVEILLETPKLVFGLEHLEHEFSARDET